MVCLVLCSWNNSGGTILKEEKQTPKKLDLRTELINIASSQIGVQEATGNNDGKDVYKYQKNIGLRPGTSWCAAFIVWCLDSLQKVTDRKLDYPRSGIAANMVSRNNVYIRGKTKNVWDFKKGKIAGEGYNTVTHASIIVERWDAHHYITIGGNETNGVRRSVKHIKYLIRVSDYLKN